ncbi:MAG: efflux RND transporter periplasmic adaptor subunit [Pseudomonadales bacterium]|jgi:macrolide-specific efflux system membrane fusion protein|nr:efflux RND transporter periplasmic adaptor subunit [Pseudomonadales bacterium]
MKDDTDAFPTARARRKRFLLISAVLLLAVGGGAYWYWHSARQAKAEDMPLLATVTLGTIENTIAASGTLKPSRYVDVGAQVSGQLTKLHVAIGDVVSEGQLLAEIDARVQVSKVEASRASIASQEAQVDARLAALELAKANAARQQRLTKDNATSQLEYDTSINNLASAESSLIQLQKQIEQSKATLSSDETQLGYTKIYAPISGTVVSNNMIEGVTLNATQTAPTILRIADLSTMTVEAGISEADVGSVHKDMEVYFTTLGSGARRWYSTVRQMLPTPAVSSNVVLYTGRFDADNSDGTLLPEMTAQVYFVTSGAHNVLTVPLGALEFTAPPEGNGGFVARQGGEGQGPGGAGQGGGARVRPQQGGGGGGGFTLPGNGGGLARPAPGAGAPQVRPRPATVSVVKADGSREQRQVLIGVTSRISAEVITGLSEGEQVVAGIVQASPTANAQQQLQQQWQQQVQNRGGGGGGGGQFRVLR